MFARFSRHQQKLPDWGIIEAALRLQQRDFLAERPIGKAKRMIEQRETEQFLMANASPIFFEGPAGPGLKMGGPETRVRKLRGQRHREAPCVAQMAPEPDSGWLARR